MFQSTSGNGLLSSLINNTSAQVSARAGGINGEPPFGPPARKPQGPGLLGNLLSPENSVRIAALGGLISDVAEGRRPDVSPALAKLQQMRQQGQLTGDITASGLLDQFTPEQRSVLQMLPPDQAQEYIASIIMGRPTPFDQRRGAAGATGATAYTSAFDGMLSGGRAAPADPYASIPLNMGV